MKLLSGGGDGYMPEGAEIDYEESLKGRCLHCGVKHSDWGSVMGCDYCHKVYDDEIYCPDCGEKIKEYPVCNECGEIDWEN